MNFVLFTDAVADVTAGCIKIKRRDYKTAGTLPVVDQGQEFIGGYVDEVALAFQGQLPVIVFGDHTRVFKLVDTPFALGADGVRLLQPKEEFDAHFLTYFFRSRNLPNLGYSRHYKLLKEIRVPKIPIAEQHRIVDLLSRAEGIVRLCREAQRKAAELIPAIFLDMFGDPATNPKRWPMVTLSEVLAACDYGTSKKASPDDAGVPMLRMGNVTYEGELDLSNLKHVELDTDELAKQSLLAGDLLFNRTNSKELVGKTGIWDGRWPAVAASYFIRLRVDADCILPFYVWAVMNSRHLKRRLFATARGAIGQANINTRELKALPIALPPLDLQRQFAAKAEAVRVIAARQTAALATAQATFDALLHQAFA